MVKLVKSKFELEGKVFERSSVVEGTEPTAWKENEPLKNIGSKVPRIDGPQKVTGRAKYTFDIQLPGMLYGRILRSPLPHAQIKHLDTGKAEAFPGVRAVISRINEKEMSWEGRPLFSEIMQFAGDEVAAVAADSEDAAAEALALIEVEYVPLPFIVNPVQPVSGQPPIFKRPGFENKPKVYERGNIEKGFREADVILEETFYTQSVLHNCMETHGGVACWNGDHLDVWESTQSINLVQQDLAATFGLPLNKVRAVCEYMGGGFGSKQSSGKWGVMAALLARRAGRPVQLILNRLEENLAAGNRAPTVQQLKIGAKADGTLTAIKLTAAADIGVSTSRSRGIEGPCQVMYACANVHTELSSVSSNFGEQRPFRGPGYVEGAFPLESMMDELAKKLKIDPIEIRMKNYAAKSYRSGQSYTGKNLDKCYRKGAEMIGWRKGGSSGGEPGMRRGFGMASQTWGGGGGPPAFAWVRLNSDGSAEVITGSQDIGTGTRTVFAQIAAEELGISPEKITVHVGDTAVGPFDPVSYGSITVPSVGPAIRQAAMDARRQLREIIAGYLDVRAEKIRTDAESVYIGEEKQPVDTIKNILDNIGDFTIIGTGARGPNDPAKDASTFGAQFAEVEVNTGTGEVNVLKLISVNDFGRVMNILGSANQIKGAVVQGIGYALTEERVIDPKSGIVLNPNLEDYKIPTALDFGDIDCAFINEPDNGANILGAKGLGEPGLIPTAPAIANAIAHALNIRFLSLPITRDKILEALEKPESQGGTYL